MLIHFLVRPYGGNYYVQWPNNLGDTLMTDIGSTVWNQTFSEATKELGNPEGSYMKNPVHIGNHLEVLKEKGYVPASLDRLCQELIRFAVATGTPSEKNSQLKIAMMEKRTPNK